MAKDLLDLAVDTLRAGRLVAFPTETVYGLGADARNPAALQLLYQTKGRPGDHPVIVHLASADQLDEWAHHVPPEARELAEAHWPGPLTLVLPRRPDVLDQVTGGQETVGLRVPGHPLALELLRRFGGGLAAPSANRFGRVSPTRAEHVRGDLPDILTLDGGPCQVGVESTIVDFAAGKARVLRPGAIRLGPLAVGPRVPGALERHYAPDTPAFLTPSPQPDPQDAVLAWSFTPERGLCLGASPESYAQGLYAALRQLDGTCARILVEEPPAEAGWEAVQDRLRRATRRFPSSNS